MFKYRLFRLEEVAALEDKYPEKLKEFLESRKEVVPVKSKQQLEAEQRAKDMLEYYGYEILPNDPRFPILFERMTEAKKKVSCYHPLIKYRLSSFFNEIWVFQVAQYQSCFLKILVFSLVFYFIFLVKLQTKCKEKIQAVKLAEKEELSLKKHASRKKEKEKKQEKKRRFMILVVLSCQKIEINNIDILQLLLIDISLV